MQAGKAKYFEIPNSLPILSFPRGGQIHILFFNCRDLPLFTTSTPSSPKCKAALT